jgi:hypothetical protein
MKNNQNILVDIDEAGADKEGITALANSLGGSLSQDNGWQLDYTFPLQTPTGDYETAYETFKNQVMHKTGVKNVKGETVEFTDDEETNPV